MSGSNSGGNRPGPTNTGPNNPSNLSNVGGMTITQDGYVLENVRIFGTVVVQANNVTIRNFILDAGFAPYGIKSINGNTGLVIEDGEIYNVDSAGVYEQLRRVRLNIHESGGDGIKTVSNALVEACWVHHLGMNPGAHADCNQTRQGGNLIFRGNYFDLPIDIGAPYKQNACWIVQTGEGPVDNVLIEGNWIEGGNYSLFIVNKYTAGSNLPNYGDPTDCRVIGNRFRPGLSRRPDHDHRVRADQRQRLGRRWHVDGHQQRLSRTSDGFPEETVPGPPRRSFRPPSARGPTPGGSQGPYPSPGALAAPCLTLMPFRGESPGGVKRL
ncbi:MAG: hypothetical protein R3F17_03755 [Planctomycetota bacterium]